MNKIQFVFFFFFFQVLISLEALSLKGGGGGRGWKGNWVNFCCVLSLASQNPTPLQSILWPIIDPIFDIVGQM